ncbi:hypothetical protein H4R18_003573 [Coemansia javaensis]|uniref:AB hydrolase-1 domain-containing protein n=1 Tax=Coemansia javaensis TaxID=2761396 RepID=A0A9W8LH31_9FUNG|nr:hypothetical protein H4R18_003573 [Coemansia javaensis]
MGYLSLLPKSWFGVRLVHAPADQQPRRGGRALGEHLRAKCPSIADPDKAYYVPSWLLPQGDLQTIYLYTQHYKPAGCPVEYEREIFVFADGGKAAVDWALPLERAEADPGTDAEEEEGTRAGSDAGLESDAGLGPDASPPLVILVPGIAGTSYDYYARSFIKQVREEVPGCRVVVLHSRGCNGVSLASPKSFHGGMTEDLREFVAHISKRMPDTPLVGVGFSLGANILTKYVGEEGDGCRLVAAAAACNPFDMDMTVDSMCVPSLKNRYLYAAALTRSLVSLFTNNENVIMAGDVALNADAIRTARNIAEFNEAYTAKVFGYASAKELNVRTSCAQFVKDVRIPMLFINALDDPMCCRRSIPVAEIERNPRLVLALTRFGGHLAFFEGTRLAPWLPRQLAQFVAAMLEWRQLPAPPPQPQPQPQPQPATEPKTTTGPMALI